MKKIILTLTLFVGISIAANAQIVFGTAQTLQKGTFSVGINPAWEDTRNEFGLLFHGGYGIGNNADLGLKLGFGWGSPYVGIDFEKTFLSGKPSLSVYAGGHYWNDFGLDLGTLVTFKASNVYITTGLDMDLIFVIRDTDGDGDEELDNLEVPLWIPLEVEWYLKKHLSLIFEADIPLNNAFVVIGGGVSIYF